MDINQLNFFVKIVQSDFNLSVAAAELFVSQSALSQMIIKYEKYYENSLFVRQKGRLISLTNFGKTVYDYAVKIVGIYEEMNAEIESYTRNNENTIKIGVPILAMHFFLFDFLIELKQQHPLIKIEIVEGNSQSLLNLLNQYKLDIILTVSETLDPLTYEYKSIYCDSLDIIMDKNHPLVNQDAVTLEEASNYPLLLFNDQYEIYHLIDNSMKSNGLEPDISMESSSWELLVSMTLHNNNITILPSASKKHINEKKFVHLPLIPEMKFELFIVRLIKKERSFAENRLYKKMIQKEWD